MTDTLILSLGLSLWGAQYFFAWLGGSLTIQQMRDRFPGDSRLPLLWHGGIWYDFPLTFWLAELAKRHPEWTWWQWSLMLIAGSATSWFMHAYVYAPATNNESGRIVTQESHVQDGEVTFVGWLHAVFFGIMFAIVGLEFVFSDEPSPAELWTTSMFLIGLLVVGNHFVLGAIKALRNGSPLDYSGQPLKSPTGWMTILGGSVTLVALTLLRTV